MATLSATAFTYFNANGTIYQCNEKPLGKPSTMVCKNGDKHSRTWGDGNADMANADNNGKGTFHYASGAKLKCFWKDGVANGPGSMHYPNGDRLDCNWVDGIGCGTGIRYCNNRQCQSGDDEAKLNDRLECNFVNEIAHGLGVRYYADGSTLECRWVNGVANEEGAKKYKNGDMLTCGWVNGVANGHGVKTNHM